jgi:hypothetical protein
MSKLVEEKTHGKTRHLTIFLSNVISLDLDLGNSSIKIIGIVNFDRFSGSE